MKTLWPILLILAAGCSTQRGFQSPTTNYDCVAPTLFRGGQFNALGVEVLRRDGIKSVLCLREDVWPAEKGLCAQAGITWTNVPISGFWVPRRSQVKTAMLALYSLPKPVLVHCQYGCDRTGLVIACWRFDQGWDPGSAWAEAKTYGAAYGSGMKTAFGQYVKSHTVR